MKPRLRSEGVPPWPRSGASAEGCFLLALFATRIHLVHGSRREPVGGTRRGTRPPAHAIGCLGFLRGKSRRWRAVLVIAGPPGSISVGVCVRVRRSRTGGSYWRCRRPGTSAITATPRKAPSGVEYSDEAQIVTMLRVSVPTRSPHWQPESRAAEIPPRTSSPHPRPRDGDRRRRVVVAALPLLPAGGLDGSRLNELERSCSKTKHIHLFPIVIKHPG